MMPREVIRFKEKKNVIELEGEEEDLDLSLWCSRIWSSRRSQQRKRGRNSRKEKDK